MNKSNLTHTQQVTKKQTNTVTLIGIVNIAGQFASKYFAITGMPFWQNKDHLTRKELIF
jgi:hypothetical protein